MGYNDRGHKAIPSWSVGLVRGLPKSSLTSPVCFLTLLAGEPSPAFCPTDFKPASPATAPPFQGQGFVRRRRGIRNPAGWAYLTRKKGQKTDL